jgi:uncharacterized membrane protein YqiK
MDELFNFLFGTRTGVAVLFFAGVAIFAIAAFVLEKRTHKIYVDRGPKPEDEDGIF